MSLIETLKDLDVVSSESSSEGLSEEMILIEDDMLRKQAQVYEMHELQGIPVSGIAAAFEVSQSTIYNWISEEKRRFREILEVQPKAEIISDSLQFLGNLRQMALFESNQSESSVDVDSSTGIVSKKPGGYIRRLKFMTLAKSVEALRLDLMKDTGVLPKVPEHIYHSLGDEKRVVGEGTEVAEERTAEEIATNITRLITTGRALP